MADSPGSPLSSHASSEFTEDVKTEEREGSIDAIYDSRVMPPTKRRRTGGAFSSGSTPVPLDPLPEDEDISSDTSGEVPSSPIYGTASNPHMQDDEQLYEQVTVCKWRSCPAGDLGNMDVLVKHIHDDHIGMRQKKYACEWEGCSRIDANHASGYALRAHMRSHTREKPFYCALPECDRSFTRSDALAKHMRTVHETEALRPSDPVPRSHSAAQIKPQRLKLIVNARPRDEQHIANGSGEHPQGEIDDDATVYTSTDIDPRDALHHNPPQSSSTFEYPPDITFTPEELAMPPNQLYRLLRRQVHWSEQDAHDLQEECEALSLKRKEEWQAKELVLANVMEAELALADRNELDIDKLINLASNFLPAQVLPIEGVQPWYRRLETFDDNKNGRC